MTGESPVMRLRVVTSPPQQIQEKRYKTMTVFNIYEATVTVKANPNTPDQVVYNKALAQDNDGRVIGIAKTEKLAREMIDDKTAIVRYEINGINYADVSFRHAVPVDYDEYEECPEDTIYGTFESR